MLKKTMVLFTIMTLLGLNCFNIYAEDFSEFQKEDLFWENAMIRSVEIGNGERHILKGYIPGSEKALVSLSEPFCQERIGDYVEETIEHKDEKCEYCGEKLMFVDILYEISSSCGHGIFSLGYYCATENIFIPETFYNQCGCYKKTKSEILPHMKFVEKYLNEIGEEAE